MAGPAMSADDLVARMSAPMTDHPIPDDLLDTIGRVKFRNGGGDWWYLGDHIARDVLAALAEWADGSLIDPETWEVMEAKPAERWHNLYDLDGKVICNHPERDHCSRADEGDWSNWTYTLRVRGGDPR